MKNQNDQQQLSEIRSILKDINNFTKLEDIEKVLNGNPTTTNTIKNQIIKGSETLEPIFFDSLGQYEKYNKENSMPCGNANTHLIPSIQFSIVDEAAKTVELRNKFNEYLATWDYLNDQVVNI